MPCPHLSKANGDCLLQQAADPDTEDGREPVQIEPVNREVCLGPRERYRECPVLKRVLYELTP